MGFSGLPASLGEQTETSHGHRLAQALGSRSKESQPLVKFLNAPRNRLCETWKELTKTGEPVRRANPNLRKKVWKTVSIAKQAKVGMIWVAGRSPTLVSHSEAWRSHES
jgi:hypothetical protein